MQVTTIVCAVLVGLAVLPRTRGEVFTAVVHMEGLMELERDLLKGLNAYIVAEKRR